MHADFISDYSTASASVHAILDPLIGATSLYCGDAFAVITVYQQRGAIDRAQRDCCSSSDEKTYQAHAVVNDELDQIHRACRGVGDLNPSACNNLESTTYIDPRRKRRSRRLRILGLLISTLDLFFVRAHKGSLWFFGHDTGTAKSRLRAFRHSCLSVFEHYSHLLECVA